MSKLQNGNGTWACMACGTTTDTAWGECPQCALVKVQRQAAEDARQFQEEQRAQARQDRYSSEFQSQSHSYSPWSGSTPEIVVVAEKIRIPEFVWYFIGGVCFIILGFVISPHIWWMLKILVYALYGWGGIMIFMAFTFSMGDIETTKFRKKAEARNATIK